MQSPSYHSRNSISKETAFAGSESVTVELPWVPLSSRKDAFLTQAVRRERAPAVRCAINLYMRCRAQPRFDVSLRRRLTVYLWHLLGAANPSSSCPGWEWDQACQQFHQMAGEFLKRTPVEGERIA